METEAQQQIVGYRDRVLIQTSAGGIELKFSVKRIPREVGALYGNQDWRLLANRGGGHGDGFRYARGFDAFRRELVQETQLLWGRLNRHPQGHVRSHQRPGLTHERVSNGFVEAGDRGQGRRAQGHGDDNEYKFPGCCPGFTPGHDKGKPEIVSISHDWIPL